jgi:hypothetical protein
MSDLDFEAIRMTRKSLIDEKKEMKFRNKQKILQCIGSNPINGKPTNAIVVETGLSRDTIHVLGKELMKEGLVSKQGHFGNYLLTLKILKNHRYLAQRLTDEILHDSLLSNHYVSLNNAFCCKDTIQKFVSLRSQPSTFFKKMSNRVGMDSILLYEFASRIGALITYLTIQAFQFGRESVPNNDARLIDRLALDWMNDTIKPHMIINEFIRFMNYNRGRIYGKDILRRTKKLDINRPELSSFYEIERKDYDRFINVFATVYPEFFAQINIIRNEKLSESRIADDIQWNDQRLETLRCRPHEFTVQVNDNKHKAFECSKCAIRYVIRLSDIVVNRDLSTRLNSHCKPPTGSPFKKKCIQQSHLWIRKSTHHDISQNVFSCLRCAWWLSLPVGNKETLHKVKGLIHNRFSEDDAKLCETVQGFFYKFSNEEHSINDLVESIDDQQLPIRFDRTRKENDDIIQRVNKIIDSLLETTFLSLGTPKLSNDNPLTLTYLHKNEINWR